MPGAKNILIIEDDEQSRQVVRLAMQSQSYLLTEAKTGDEGLEEVRAEDSLARRQGINGVPCFIFNYRFLLSGAQEPESFFQLFDLAREDEAGALRENAG